jgi:hypothetical protein
MTMTTEFRVLVVDPSAEHPADPELSLQSLREAVLGHPSLALEALRYALGSPEQVEGSQSFTGHSGKFPPDTPVFKMLSPDQAALLSPAAKQLTKADLVALQGPGSGQKLHELHLTFEDLQSVEEAFHQRFAVSGLEEMQAAEEMVTEGGGEMVDSGGISGCCCCTPCCCCTAAAVPSPLIGVA